MPLEDQFNPDEWQQVLVLPVYCAALVITGDLSGLPGLIQESQALYQVLEDTRGGVEENALARKAAETLLGRDFEAERDELLNLTETVRAEHLLAEIAGTVALVNNRIESDRRTPFFRWAYQLAEEVARAAREGGFLGLGGVRVSPKEQAVLDRLASVLQQPPNAGPG